LQGTDDFGSTHRSEFMIDKDMTRLSAGEIGLSVEDGKAIMAHLQQASRAGHFDEARLEIETWMTASSNDAPVFRPGR